MPSIIELWLRLVWKEHPSLWFCVAYLLPNGGFHQEFYQDIATCAARLALWSEQGRETYYAISAFKSKGSRAQANVAFVGCFCGDIDLAPKSSYVDAAAAALAVIGVCRVLDIPIPTFVGSGGGLHIYWLLDTFIPLHEWKAIAQGLKRALQDAGLELDPVRSADASSVLRVPGTFNYKLETPRKVEWDGNAQIHSLEPFLRFRTEARVGASIPNRGSLAHNPFGLQASRLAQAAVAYDAPHADEVANRCEHLAGLRRSGALWEPLWHACAGAMTRMIDGYAKFHEWSQRDYPGYTYEASQAKLEYAHLHTTGPTTCAHFHSLKREVCERCPLWGKITTPLRAPYERADESDVGGSDASADPVDRVNGSGAGPALTGDVELPDLGNTGMAWNANRSLVIPVEKGGKRLHDIIISQYPFYVSTINKLEGGDGRENMYTELSCLLSSGEWTTFSVANTKLYSSTGHQTLAGYGLLIRDWAYGKKAIMHMADQKKEHLVQHQRMGWKEDGSFLLGNKLYTKDDVSIVPVVPALLKRSRGLRPATGGSLAEWSQDATRFWQKGLESIGFAIMAAFAAPLMSLLSREGGAIVHLVSRTGKGKTTALEMAASVYGGFDSLRLISDDTRISKMIILGMLCHLPVVWDELTSTDPETMLKFIQTFTDGKDKARATGVGDVIETEHHWSTNMITASNQSVKELLTEQGDTAEAMMERVIEFQMETDSTYTMLEMDAIKNRMVKNAGYAGDEFIRYLVQPGVLEYARETLPIKMGEIMQTYEFKQQNRFIIRFLASMWVVAEVIAKVGLIQVSPNYVVKWTATAIKESLPKEPVIIDKTILMEAEKSSAAKRLIRFLHEYVPFMLVIKGEKEGLSSGVPLVEPRTGVVHIRHHQAERVMWISAREFSAWLIKNHYSVRDTIVELYRLRLIVSTEKIMRDLGSGTVYSFGGKTECWKVRLAGYTNPSINEEDGKLMYLDEIRKKSPPRKLF